MKEGHQEPRDVWSLVLFLGMGLDVLGDGSRVLGLGCGGELNLFCATRIMQSLIVCTCEGMFATMWMWMCIVLTCGLGLVS